MFWGKNRECGRSFCFTSVLGTPAFVLKEIFKIIRHSSLFVWVMTSLARFAISANAHALVTSSFSETKVFFFVQPKLSRRCPWKTELFEYVSSENEAQISKSNNGPMLFMSKQASLPKISSILQKMKIGPKRDIGPFFTKAFNYQPPVLHVSNKTWTPVCL